jgi:Fe-S-cluster containining protein
VAREQLIERLRDRLSLADAAWEEAASRTKKGDLLCRSGCFGCCFGLFEISLPEALVVRAAVVRLPDPVARIVRERAARISRESAAAFPGDAEAGILDPSRTEEADALYFDGMEHAACPLLDLPSGRCTVYASRPATCRTYGLAWKEDEALVHPACSLNLPGATKEHTLTAAVDVSTLLGRDQTLAEIAFAAGLPAGIATTVAHAITGAAFDTFDAPDPAA